MPTYGYECQKCQNEFEKVQSIKDPALKTCPNCSGRLRKKIYSVGVVFKGNGFYTTDYKKSSPELG